MPSPCEASARETRVHSLAACASAEGVCRPTIAGASDELVVLEGASTMNGAKVHAARQVALEDGVAHVETSSPMEVGEVSCRYAHHEHEHEHEHERVAHDGSARTSASRPGPSAILLEKHSGQWY